MPSGVEGIEEEFRDRDFPILVLQCFKILRFLHFLRVEISVSDLWFEV